MLCLIPGRHLLAIDRSHVQRLDPSPGGRTGKHREGGPLGEIDAIEPGASIIPQAGDGHGIASGSEAVSVRRLDPVVGGGVSGDAGAGYRGHGVRRPEKGHD